jgi:hypothetical protein
VVQNTKLPKVVKHIALLETAPPKEDQFNFKERSAKLVERWKSLVYPGGDTATGSPVPAQAEQVESTAVVEAGEAAAKEESTEQKEEPKEVETAVASAVAEPATNGDSSAEPTTVTAAATATNGEVAAAAS